MGRLSGAAIALAGGLLAWVPVASAQNVDVGAMASVQRAVYGVPPQGSQAVKQQGDTVVFQEALETVENGAALVRFVDDSTLALGAKSKVVIDSFVFDPQTAQGNALINISVGTLRFVTGGMPKGGTTIKTPTATLVLRGTDVTVHVHPDGTTDTTVHEGEVDAHNDQTNETSNLQPGDGATIGEGGNSCFDGDNPSTGPDEDGGPGDPPEHRRAADPKNQRPDHTEHYNYFSN